ncbi:MAG: class I SAM-dependent methyltransferase [Gammaproteobacteria bacterium]|nr:class I SAM-dependent methyltransferase [Gammaproteobacteria bacterium]
MKQTPLTPALNEYAEHIGLREHPQLTALRLATAHLSLSPMQSPPLQAQFLQFLIQLTQAKQVLELGTYTGYATLAMALALPTDGHILTCDINPEWTGHGRPFWEQAGLTHKITLKLAPALETLATLKQEQARFDFIFIDADKTHYVEYYEDALHLLNPHGIIVIDNIFWDGLVIDPLDKGAQTREIRKLNTKIQHDSRVDLSLLPFGDGVFLIKHRTSHQGETPCLHGN